MKNKRGISSIVAVALITLIAIVGAAIFLGAYLRSVKSATANDQAACFGIEIGIKNCFIFNETINPLLPVNVPPLNGHAVLVNIERAPGGEEIKDLRILSKDTNGEEHVATPVNVSFLGFRSDTDYSDLVEFSSIEAVARDLPYRPVSVRVSAIVGKSNTLCNPTVKQVMCKYYP